MDKKLITVILITLIAITALTVIVISQKPQMHKTFILQQIIIKKEAAK